MTPQSEEELQLVVEMFGAGKELSAMYDKYDGDLDWNGWLKETLPKVPVFFDTLHKLISIREIEARLDELKSLKVRGKIPEIVRWESNATIFPIEDRIKHLEAKL